MEHIKLQCTHNANDHFFHTGIGHLEDLDGTFLCDLFRTLDKLLALHGVLGTDTAEMLRGKGGDTGVQKLLSGHCDGVANGKNARVKHADHVAGIGFLYDFPLRSHQLLGLRKTHLSAALHMVVFRVTLEFARADPHKGQPVPVSLVHIGLDLKHESRKIRIKGIHNTAVSSAGQGRGRQLQESLQERLNAEVRQCRAEEYGRKLATANSLHVHFPACGQKLHIIDQLLVLGFTVQKLGNLRIVQINRQLVSLSLAADTGKEQKLCVLTVVYALKILAGADRPVHGISLNSQFPLHFVQQIKGILGLPVHLVNEGKNGNVPHGADLKQLPGLGLDTFSTVDDHDSGVCRHQGAVGVLGEVLVTGGVQNIDAEATVLELHDRGGNRDTSLLFDFHPVRGGGPGIFLALDNTCLGDGTAVQQEFFC